MRFSCILTLVALLLCCVSTVDAASISASDDTILLQNGAPNFANQSDAEDNFGGRTELIIGPNNGNERIGLLRFDVSSLSTQISNGDTVLSASLTLHERSGRNGIQPAGSTTFVVDPLVAANAGWVEGTKAGSAGGFSGQPGSVSYLYHTTPTAAGAGDGLQWESATGGVIADPIGAIPDSVFTPGGADTGASLGTGVISNDGGDADESWTISLDAAAIQALLPGWLADPTGNAGVSISRDSGDSGQWFFGSVESGAGTDPAAVLDITFVPEPSSLVLGLFGLAVCAVRRRS